MADLSNLLTILDIVKIRNLKIEIKFIWNLHKIKQKETILKCLINEDTKLYNLIEKANFQIKSDNNNDINDQEKESFKGLL